MRKIFFVVLVISIVSCKNDKSLTEKVVEPVEEVVEVKKPKKFIIELELKLSESDIISLSGNDLFINNNRTINIGLKEKVTKSEGFKTIVLDWPENIEPDYSVALNAGKVVKSIVLKEVRMSYGDVEFVILPQEFKEFFITNKYIDYNPETGVLQTKKNGGKSNPILYIKKHIIDKLTS